MRLAREVHHVPKTPRGPGATPLGLASNEGLGSRSADGVVIAVKKVPFVGHVRKVRIKFSLGVDVAKFWTKS